MDFEKILKEKLRNEEIEQLKRQAKTNIQLEELENKIAENVEYWFNQSINCGGYALKIDTCIFPGKGDFERRVSGILESFPFVRLLGDTSLEEDEYLVLYRSLEEGGHHFVRIEDDGTVMEKEGCQPPQKFQGWGKLENAPEAVFAVKKEHEINYFKENGSINIPTPTSMNFEETILQAIENRQNAFEYHQHNYILKKAEGIIYICNKTEVIAQMIIDKESYDIEINNGKQAYVSNTQPSNPIIIRDGKYQKANQDEITH